MAEIKADENLLGTLGDELTGLFRKLPADYRQDDGALDPANPVQLRQIVNQAHALLTKGLKKEARDA